MQAQLAQSMVIRKNADKFLAEKNIQEKLSSLGEVIFVGSYATDLMTWNDIDIQLVLPKNLNPLRTLTRLANDFLEDQDVQKIHMINFSPGKKEGMPIGVYLGVDYKIANKEKWKVDIWSLSEADLDRSKKFNEHMLNKLTPEIRELILKLKFYLIQKKDRVPKLASYYIYNAVFNEQIYEEQAILKYLQDKNIISWL